MKKPLLGKLHHYFATGESNHAQFIGYKDKNCSQTYSIQKGDLISIAWNKIPIRFYIVDMTLIEFLRDLSIASSDLEFLYIPKKDHKSWGYHMNSHKEAVKKKIKKNS